MMMMKKKLACCMREISIDFDEHERIMMYNGLEMCILNSHESGASSGNGCWTDSFEEYDSTSSSSSTSNPFGSFSSIWWTFIEKDDSHAHTAMPPENLNVKEKQEDNISDMETMKEKFTMLLLGEDVTGGARGVSTALALSNAITTLAATLFGELWKLEPLPDEIKSKWQREMEWLLSPTNYIIELVPIKQDGVNGSTFEIMIPQARRDIHMNLPALRKLDSMLIESLDSMVDTEFWYAEASSLAEGRSQTKGTSMRGWLPSRRVPTAGLSEVERKRLLHEGKLIYQVFKAAKSINENVLVEMPIPAAIKDALPKSGKANLGNELHKTLCAESLSPEEMVNCMNLKSEHSALEAINRLEAAILAWKEKTAEHGNGKPPLRPSWSFVKDSHSKLDRLELLLDRAELLVLQLKIKYPNLPRSFLDVTKIQYGMDVGCSILEAYSRVLSNLAYSILSRIGDILQEDMTSSPNSLVAMSQLIEARIPGISDSPTLDRMRHSLIHQLNCAEGKTG